MYAFDFHRPCSIPEAEALLAKGGQDASLLAGGHTLIPSMKQRLARPPMVVDLSGISELRTIGENAGALMVGAMVPHADVASSETVRRLIPALASLADGIGDPQVRNRGTIGGSVANNDPAADYPAAVLALNATVHTNRRTLSGENFFVGMFTTALEPGEIITAIRFPVPEKAAYVKFPNPASRYAIVGVFVAKLAGQVRVAVTGAASAVFRWTAAEAALTAQWSAQSVKGLSMAAGELNRDIHASAEYRAHLVSVMTARAVTAA